MVELSCKHRCQKLWWVEHLRFWRLTKWVLESGMVYPIPSVYGIFYLHLEMVSGNMQKTWMLGRYPDPLFCKEYDIWCETLWFYYDVYRPFKTLFNILTKYLNPSPKELQKGSLTINQDGCAHGTYFSLLFFLVVPRLGRWNLMEQFELVIQLESNSIPIVVGSLKISTGLSQPN